MKKFAVAAVMTSLLLVSSAHSQEDPRAQQRRDAKQIDEKYELTKKRSSWAKSPKPMTDPWQSVKSPPPKEEK